MEAGRATRRPAIIKVVKDQRASWRLLTRLKENVIGSYDTVSDTSHPITCSNMENRDQIQGRPIKSFVMISEIFKDLFKQTKAP